MVIKWPPTSNVDSMTVLRARRGGTGSKKVTLRGGCGGPFRSSSLGQVGAQGPQFDADKTVRLHVVSDPAADNRLRFGPACRELDASPSSTRLRPRALFCHHRVLLSGRAPSPREWLTIPARAKR